MKIRSPRCIGDALVLFLVLVLELAGARRSGAALGWMERAGRAKDGGGAERQSGIFSFTANLGGVGKAADNWGGGLSPSISGGDAGATENGAKEIRIDTSEQVNYEERATTEKLNLLLLTFSDDRCEKLELRARSSQCRRGGWGSGGDEEGQTGGGEVGG